MSLHSETSRSKTMSNVRRSSSFSSDDSAERCVAYKVSAMEAWLGEVGPPIATGPTPPTPPMFAGESHSPYALFKKGEYTIMMDCTSAFFVRRRISHCCFLPRAHILSRAFHKFMFFDFGKFYRVRAHVTLRNELRSFELFTEVFGHKFLKCVSLTY